MAIARRACALAAGVAAGVNGALEVRLSLAALTHHVERAAQRIQRRYGLRIGRQVLLVKLHRLVDLALADQLLHLVERAIQVALVHHLLERFAVEVLVANALRQLGHPLHQLGDVSLQEMKKTEENFKLVLAQLPRASRVPKRLEHTQNPSEPATFVTPHDRLCIKFYEIIEKVGLLSSNFPNSIGCVPCGTFNIIQLFSKFLSSH